MSNGCVSTAILLFARTVEEESSVKKLLGKEQVNKKLHHTLNDSSKKTIQRTRLPHYHINESLQVGTSFGEKMSNALKTVFSKGYNRIVVIGGDCPDLTEDEITKADRLLQENKVVLGPDTHGGSYLIGINKVDFDGASFSRLRWNSSNLLTDLIYYFQQKEERKISFLYKKRDLNSVYDVIKLSSKSSKFRALLLCLFTQLSWIDSLKIPFFSLQIDASHLERGPPYKNIS